MFAPLLALCLFGGTAQAEEQPVLVELFTSQGCSSCPPADAFLHDLAAREDVIALALHVDIWDYIGWKDRFASPRYSARQRGYADAWNQRMVYTPQMVIDGAAGVVGNKPRDVEAMIARERAKADRVDLRLSRDAGVLTIEATPLTETEGDLDIMVARFDPERTIEITRGENAGHRFSYANVVTDLRDVGDWSADAPIRMNLPLEGDEPVAVFVQQKGMGRVEAAAALR
ncbi:DUF1223 domain-containing protein [Roseovarius sp. SCSIO 43702]|nr:DUF1223 domain-containing protein [Roseovarius sp. SCSIO 43702]